MDDLLLRIVKAFQRHGSKALSIESSDETITLTSKEGRTQEIHIHFSEGRMSFSCVVVGAGKIRSMFYEVGLADLIWPRNREVQLVHFCVDDRGRLSSRVTLSESVSDAALAWSLGLLAFESERLSFLLLGPQNQVGHGNS